MKMYKKSQFLLFLPGHAKNLIMKKIIHTEQAPKAIGPYSQAIEVNGMLFISGQIPVNPEDGQIPESIEAQTEQVMKNIGAILNEAGYGFEHVVKSTCLLSDMANFKAMNEIYGKYYAVNPPARAAFAVKALPLNVLVEIETIAVK
jgi:2-iminobutanoate/2-iminopropanoate deaminase